MKPTEKKHSEGTLTTHMNDMSLVNNTTFKKHLVPKKGPPGNSIVITYKFKHLYHAFYAFILKNITINACYRGLNDYNDNLYV